MTTHPEHWPCVSEEEELAWQMDWTPKDIDPVFDNDDNDAAPTDQHLTIYGSWVSGDIHNDMATCAVCDSLFDSESWTKRDGYNCPYCWREWAHKTAP